MFLAIDVGNTNIVLGVFDGDTLVEQWRVPPADFILHSANPLEEDNPVTDFAGGGEAFVKVGELGDMTAVYVSSVVPQVDPAILKLCKVQWGVDVVFVNTEVVGIAVETDKPDEVGADRLVNAVSVAEHYQSPAVVIDFGTATTFDVIGEGGAYVGGVIAPGINLSLEALEKAAAKLPNIDVVKPDQVIGKDTVSAMHSGVFYGYLGLIEGIVRNITDELGVQPFVLATGGLAPLFSGSTDVIEAVDQDLTLKGLNIIYKRNHG